MASSHVSASSHASASSHVSDPVTADMIEAYRRDGFVQVPGIITPEQAAEFREAAVRYAQGNKSYHGGSIFLQHVNVWREDETMRRLTLDDRLGAAAKKLAGVPLRLWHDQILIKEPHKSLATEFHQDQPYWPHADSHHPISAWIALVDVPVERGCMTFLPGSHSRDDLPAQSLHDDQSLFTICPELRWSPRVTLPLRAGDCTFHHGRCAHMATPNLTDEARVAHAVIFMDTATTYSGKPHVVTDPLGLEAGQPLDGELFPEVGT